MNCCRETAKMSVPPSNRRMLVPRSTELCVAGADTRGRQEGRPYPWSQQVIHEISGLDETSGLPQANNQQNAGEKVEDVE